MLSSLFSVLFLGICYLVGAVPVKPAELLAYAPTITSPANGDVWIAGNQYTVSWVTSSVPQAAQNYTLVMVLGYAANNSENLDYRHPLASQVPIMQGSVAVTIPPNTTFRADYIIVVIGDSGNASPAFTIMPNASSPSAASY